MYEKCYQETFNCVCGQKPGGGLLVRAEYRYSDVDDNDDVDATVDADTDVDCDADVKMLMVMLLLLLRKKIINECRSVIH